MRPPLPVATIRPSRLLLRWSQLLYALAALIPLFLPWPLALRLPLFLLIIGDGWWQRRAIRRAYGIAALRVLPDHQLQVRYQDEDDWQTVDRKAGSHLLPGLLILHVQVAAGRAQRWLLLPDMLAAEDWHRLKLWARWKWAQSVEHPPSPWQRVYCWLRGRCRRKPAE